MKTPEDFGNQIADSIIKAMDILAEPSWIPVEERLPEPMTFVLTFSALGQIVGYLAKNGDWHAEYTDCETGEPYIKGSVTHWMNLPEPPQ